jgi:hypothetical protein
MLMPLLLQMALGSGKVQVVETEDEYRLMAPALGVKIKLAAVKKEDYYQMIRTPEMPATLTEAIAQRAEQMALDAPKPLLAVAGDSQQVSEAPRPPKGKPTLTVVK